MFPKTAIITVQNIPVTILNLDQREYISLTDMAKTRADSSRAADVIKNWLRARSMLEFLGTGELTPVKILPLNLAPRSVPYLNFIS